MEKGFPITNDIVSVDLSASSKIILLLLYFFKGNCETEVTFG